ncbi:GNAT family N-acetyltransferase [Erythrobacter sp. CCH5-A1]|jgi:predicted GNAT family acetyltransferase|uniref:GNAT family N-acetyltransferase n=1 Tax=Erythrobacter sp. CCH5-A1 TaxID=1768792 RepID=UPI00083458EB|nr:GNAT family N-acetyltransferase [Erythrobacter sp. CCH5-A1]
MSDIAIRLDDRGRKGRYFATVEGREGEAYIAFTHHEEGVISADHTIAPDSLKGTGAAFSLVEYLVADARARGFRIIPVCPYVRAQYRKHPEWADAFTVPPEWEPEATA